MYSTHGNPCVHFSGPTGPIVDPTSTKRYHKIVYFNVKYFFKTQASRNTKQLKLSLLDPIKHPFRVRLLRALFIARAAYGGARGGFCFLFKIVCS